MQAGGAVPSPAMSETPLAFPAGFQWGTATASHQIEGGNWNNDWWRWEHVEGSIVAEPSGDACDSWHRWEQDADVVAEAGLGSYRFSLEWSRIQPEEGVWSTAALDRYARQCDGLIARGLDPVVTFHHFTTPRWVADRGGWENDGTVDLFADFCARAARHLGADRVARACTINEPNIVGVMGYLLEAFPPGVSDRARADDVLDRFVVAHRRSVEALRSELGATPIGLTLAMADWVAVGATDEERDQAQRRMERNRARMEDRYLEAVVGDDFLGVQAYSRYRYGPGGMIGPEEGVPTLVMGYEYWPQALEASLRRAWEVTGGQVPLLVTENGIATEDDAERIAYVRAALEGVQRCLADGIDVGGYTYWSLLDNFEWAYGYAPRFGLVEVDRTTFVRTPKPSARWLGEVARANALPPA